jgi:hypothetical protein
LVSPRGKGKDFEQAVYITDVAKNCKLKMDKIVKYFPLKIKKERLNGEGILKVQVS